MNILFLNSASRDWGGNEQSIFIAANALAEYHTIILGYRNELLGRHFTIRKYKLPFFFEADLYTIFSLTGIVRKHRIEVIISTKRKDYAIGGIVARICGIKNVIWLGANRQLKKHFLNQLVYKKLAAGIIVNARQIKETLFETPFMLKQNIRVIYNGIDTKKLDQAKKTPDSPEGKFTVTAMGRIDRNKGFDFLLRSFARFLSLKPDIKAELVIIGDGPLREEYEMLTKDLQLQESVRFTGFLSDPYPELLFSDVFVSSSISEGLSIAILEAMYLLNAPVSTFAGGGIAEIIEHGRNGFLCDYGDETALSEILLNLYGNIELRTAVAEKAKISVAERYSLQNMALEISDFCHSSC